MTGPSAAELDREIAAQAAIAQRVIADAQSEIARLEDELATVGLQLEDRTAELAAVRAELADARAQLQWLRRAGVDLNAVMDHPVPRGLRAVGRRGRAVVRRIPRGARGL